MEEKHKFVDHLMTSIGQPGKFQMLVFALLCVNIFTTTSNHLAILFFAAKTPYHCKVGAHSAGPVEDVVPTLMKNNKEWDGCHVYAGNNTTVTVPCANEWTYYLEDGEATIISEFDLVCDDAYKSDLASTIYFCGVTLGGPLFGSLADKYGRKPVIGFTLFVSGIIGVAIVIFRTYIAYIALRFMLGFVLQGLHNTTISFAMELVSTKYRPHAGVIIAGCSSIGALILDLIAYMVKDWKYIQLTLAIIAFLQLGSLWIMPESIRLHILHNKYEKAEATIQKVVNFNKIPFPREIFEQIKGNRAKNVKELRSDKKGNMFDIFKFAAIRNMTFILFFIWFSIGATFYGLAFNISYLAGNKYLNVALSSLLDIFVVISMFWLVPRYGRRKPLFVVFLICSVASFACSIITSQASGKNNLKYIATLTALVGKSCMAGSLCIIYLLTSEVYPTVIRNVSLGVNTVWLRIGAMAAPQILYLGVYTSLAFVPYILFGVFVLCSGLLTLLLPDTHNKALTDRLNQYNQRMECLPDDDVCGKSSEMVEEICLFETTV